MKETQAMNGQPESVYLVPRGGSMALGVNCLSKYTTNVLCGVCTERRK